MNNSSHRARYADRKDIASTVIGDMFPLEKQYTIPYAMTDQKEKHLGQFTTGRLSP